VNINWVALIVLIFLFAVVTVMGFQAARWGCCPMRRSGSAASTGSCSGTPTR
jgi:hypothetical protein